MNREQQRKKRRLIKKNDNMNKINQFNRHDGALVSLIDGSDSGGDDESSYNGVYDSNSEDDSVYRTVAKNGKHA